MTKSNIKKYKNKPVVIEALEWTDDNDDEIDEFIQPFGIPSGAIENGDYLVKSDGGYMSIWEKEKFRDEFEEITD